MSSTEQTSEGSVAVVSGRVVTPERVIEGGVRIEGDRIIDVGSVDGDADTVIEADDPPPPTLGCADGVADGARLGRSSEHLGGYHHEVPRHLLRT